MANGRGLPECIENCGSIGFADFQIESVYARAKVIVSRELHLHKIVSHCALALGLALAYR